MSIMLANRGKKISATLVCVLFSVLSVVHAQKEAFSQKLAGFLKPGDSCVVIDDKYARLDAKEWNSIKHKQVQDLIFFELRFDTLAYIPQKPFNVEILVDIYYWKSDQQQEKPEEKKNISLRIEYDTVKGKAIKTTDFFEFKDAHKVAVVIRKIKSAFFKDSLPPFFQLKNEIFVQRKYAFDAKKPVAMNIGPSGAVGANGTEQKRSSSGLVESLIETEGDCGAAATVYPIAIPATPTPPDEYDIEYCFIDFESEEGYAIRALGGVSALTDLFLKPLFRFNSTRVTIPAAITSYNVNLVYPKGYMLYRIRGVDYTDDFRNEDIWTYIHPSTGDVYGHGIGDEDSSPKPHEGCLNWQYNASFAEDGKHKEVVSYFDGKLQTRQTVTLSRTHISNSEDPVNAVVQESILDEFGRPAVNILPAPVNDDKIKFYRNFNLADAGTSPAKPYNYTNFIADGEGSECSIFAQPLKADSWGAAQYYSTNNPFKTMGSHQFVPNADGYPFTATQYTPDQTGRIRNQGGVGAKFQIKKDDATNSYKYSKYFYGKPTQFELDRLFGSEAGNSSHYQKNMVVDPNGQISISYVNSTGKTIATALGGKVTANLDQLPSYYESYAAPGTKLIKPSDFIFDATTGELQATATFLAPVTGFYEIQNTLETIQYNVFHGNNLSDKLCYTCYYDIEVDVRNSCNASLLVGGPQIIAAGTFDPNTSCFTTSPHLDEYNLKASIDAANIGECFVTYTLKLSSNAKEFYTKDHWESNTSLKKFKDFFRKLINESSLIDCYSECEPCKELAEIGHDKFVADLKLYMQKIIAEKNDPNIVFSETDMDALLDEMYNNLIGNCSTVLANCTEPSPCQNKLNIMINDVSLGGQYALYDSSTFLPKDDPSSVLVGSPAKYTLIPDGYPTGTPLYPDPNNPTVSDIVIIGGVSLQPEQLSPEEFIRNFRPHWANTLVLWHPEYCYYTWCIINEPSRAFDEKIKNMSAEDAITNGYFYPGNPFSLLNEESGTAEIDKDPFFDDCGRGALYKDAMVWELQHFSKTKMFDATVPTTVTAPDMDILEFIDHTIYCSDGDWSLGGCHVGEGCRKREREWQLYVQFYLQLKQQYDEMARRCWKSECINCYIGTDGVKSDFIIADPACTHATPNTDWAALLPSSCEAIEPCISVYDPRSTIETCMSSLCESHDRRRDYENKTRIYPDYVNPCSMAGASCINPYAVDFVAHTNTQITQMFNENCTAAVDNLLEELEKRSSCLDAIRAVDLRNMRDDLIEACSQGLLEINPVNSYGIIQLLHTDAVSSSSKTTFDNILLSYGVVVANGCSSDLVGLPYPHDKQTYQLAQKTIDRGSDDICKRLDRFSDAYYTLHAAYPDNDELYIYMQSLLKQDFTLTRDEFEDLMNTCSSKCNPKLLDNDILLPAALTKDDGCRTCSEIELARRAFLEKYPSITSSDPQYELLFKNFMNHYLGYALSYVDYYEFIRECGTGVEGLLLCNQSAAPNYAQEQYNCLKDKIDNAFTGAVYLLYTYKDSVDQDFKNAYTFTCRYVKPTINLAAPFQEYHYTLYYYDQAGNLVKTVPPQGVTTLSDAAASAVGHPWESTTSQAALEIVGTKHFDLASSPISQEFAMEMQVRLNASSSLRKTFLFVNLNQQRIRNTVTNEYKYAEMRLEIPASTSSFNLVITSFTGTAPNVYEVRTTYTFGTSSFPAGAWKHLVFTTNPMGSYILYIDGKPYTPTAVTNMYFLLPHYADPETISGTNITVSNGDGLFGSPLMAYKEFRIYNRPLLNNEVGFNRMLVTEPYSTTGLQAYYKMDEGSGTDLNNLASSHIGYMNTAYWQDNSSFTPTSHLFVTSYAYNSLNQVVKQHTPDGGSSQFWYDRLGRLVISQNEEQKTSSVGDANGRFSYTKYDFLGRISEVGEKTEISELADDDVRENTTLQSWLDGGIDKQITLTRYTNMSNTLATDGHTINDPSTGATPIVVQENLRNRVAATFYIEAKGQSQQFATYYNYDISGNVKTLWQELVPMHSYDQSGFKRMDYQYDLVSGKVNEVWYQQGKVDQYYYRYSYDAENRLTQAWSGRSSNTTQCKLDASYFYYLHGPLARTELGEADNELQGIDYAYSLQGWLKGVNSTIMNPDNDMGEDGKAASATHANFGRDVYSFGLNYFTGDYSSIGTAQPFKTYGFSLKTDAQPVGRQLFNGNIAAISLSLNKLNNGATTGYSYGYDQLNRLMNMRKHNDNITGNWDNTSIASDAKYAETYSYDANGNILSLNRNGANTATSPLSMDKLNYRYYYVTTSGEQREYYFSNSDKMYHDQVTGSVIDVSNVRYFSNKLSRVLDRVNANNYTTDIDHQGDEDYNYRYDHIGNLIGDYTERISSIKWTVYGKIKSIDKLEKDGHAKNIQYQYDVSGNRVMKKVNNKISFYIRDAQGNTMAVYDAIQPASGSPTGYTWMEQDLYGSSRLGMFTPRQPIPLGTMATEPTPTDPELTGQRTYELSNHLGNVHVTISNKKIEVAATPSNYWIPEILSTTDYYPFGMAMPERSGYKVDGGWATGTDNLNGNSVPQQMTVDSRTADNPAEYKASSFIEFITGFVSGTGDEFVAYIANGTNTPGGSSGGTGSENLYRYGFNGKENDKDIGESGQDYGMRIYDGRLGRFLSEDPITKEYPELTPYQYASNRPIDGIDMDGLEYLTYRITISKTTSKITNQVYVWHNENQNNAHGHLGQGVMYKIRINDEANNSFSFKSVFVSRDASTLFGLVSTEYGNYMGATSLYEVDINGEFIKDGKHYDYSLPAVDAVDNFAKQHDIGYDKLNAVGETGLFDDWGTTPVDEAALNGWNDFRANHKVGSADPFNGNTVTKEERGAAWRGATLFDEVVSNKKGEISFWMQQNYKGEAANHINKGIYGAKDVAKNYQLFLNKYMSKDKDGNWIRKENMWSKDKKGNWTPNKPKE